ncbi:tyrosine-type recombinase/integrase [Paraliomyxa miuraensis]|nr:tyrosine-type recombinase/integrase [Paraliomyxa miuraensis]
MRRGEIMALEWSDIDLTQGRLTVARSEFRGHVTSTKGYRNRTVPLSDDLKRALEQHRMGGPRILHPSAQPAPDLEK